MKKLFSAPNIAVAAACLAWVIGFGAALIAIADPVPPDPSSAADKIRFETTIHRKGVVARIGFGLSILFSCAPYVLVYGRWQKARVRFSFALLICSSYFASLLYIFGTNYGR